MTLKKRFKSTNTSGNLSPISGANSSIDYGYQPDVSYRNYKSNLPEVYSGHPNRVERYNQYEAMDLDSEVNACLDIIAEFSTQVEEASGMAFNINFTEDPTEHETKLIYKELRQWINLNEFDRRIFRLFRNTIKYGDQLFVRDPETHKLFWIEMNKVSKIIVDESLGKVPEQYIIQDINVNLQNLTVAAKTTTDLQTSPPGGAYTAPYSYNMPNNSAYRNQGRFSFGENETAIGAEHVVHLSLTEGLDYFWPFGSSILENVYKVFKQKELLEDAILIYRIQRAPERRVFNIDVGNLPPHLAMGYVERLKNEIHQRRIPSMNGQGGSVLDAAYNPLSMLEDYFFPKGVDGRGSTVEPLPGGDNLGQIDDLRFFNNKLARGLRVPSSYLPTGPDDGQVTLNDGRLGSAMIEEKRFNEYCKRLQSRIIPTLDKEFKMYLKWRGFNLDMSMFELQFNPPQNFAAYRQAELDATNLANLASVLDIPFISYRFALTRYGGWSEEDLQKNNKMWREENDDAKSIEAAGSDMRVAGVSPGDFDADMGMADMVDNEMEMPPEGEMGAEPGAPEVGGPPSMGPEKV